MRNATWIIVEEARQTHESIGRTESLKQEHLRTHFSKGT